MTKEQHQKAVHLLANQATLDATVDELAAHYYQVQVTYIDMLDATVLQYVLEEAGYKLEDLT